MLVTPPPGTPLPGAAAEDVSDATSTVSVTPGHNRCQKQQLKVYVTQSPGAVSEPHAAASVSVTPPPGAVGEGGGDATAARSGECVGDATAGSS